MNADLISKGWRQELCLACGASGQESDYGNGEDFYGPKECTTCKGLGRYWITPNKRHVLYPGGPFC